MAEIVLYDTAGSIIRSLSSLALQEIGVLWGFKNELRKLGDTVSTIQAVLLDSEEKQAHNHAIKDWLRKLKDAMYDADDLLDDYSTQLLRRQLMTRDKKMAKQVRIFFSKSNQLVYGFKMGHRIKAVRARLDEIAIDRIKFGFNEHTTATQFEHVKRQDTHSFVHGEDVIGREDDKESIKKLLFDPNMNEKNVSIIPIVGIGGQGKTTLAQYVYNDEEVRRHFDLRMWACVSDPFDVKTIIVKLIESATKERPKSLEMDPLQSELRAKIDGKRYLLVLDDVWNENHGTWSNLEKLLVGGLRGSKVLITTRSEKIAEITGTISPYPLRGLSESSSWNLFKKMAFKNGEEPNNPKLVEIGREIIQKCAQVPLAIRSIGSLLYFKNSEDDWLYFKNHDLYKITQQENDIFPILKLSYDHLPSHLKQCFAFCSLFPKDYEIEMKVLIQLWIAQGFLHSSYGNRHLEDIGHEYFMDLLWRSFFQDVQRDIVGEIGKCKMHDLIHDLAQSVAGEECTILYPDREKVDGRTRHVAFHSSDSLPDIPALLPKPNKIRTLLLRIPILPGLDDVFNWNNSVLELNKPVFNTLISSFKCLRALNLSRSNIQKVPNSIGKLEHLRFLDLSRNEDIKLLPASITKLQNLQTLRLEFCRGLKELPEETGNLISLRHLGLEGCDSLTHMPHGLGKLITLQTLSLYILGKKKSFLSKPKGGLGELDGLDELRGDLLIKGLEHSRYSPSKAKAANLERKQHLQWLMLEWDPEPSDESDKAIANDEQLLQNLRPHLNLKLLSIAGYAGVRLSSWVSSLSNLTSIIISDCKWLQHIPPLDRFPFLERLFLTNLNELEYISNDGSDVSSSPLKFLALANLPKLRGWLKTRETDHLPLFPSFPSLSFLSIQNCPMMSLTTPSSPSPLSDLSKLKYLYLLELEQLEYLPLEWLQNLTSLETLGIFDCRKMRISISPLFQHLTSLENLTILRCKELTSNENEDGAHGLGPTRFGHLSIIGVPNLVSLPRELRDVTTLQGLQIMVCPSLVSLPEWISDLTSLQELEVVNCPKLISLPEGMRRLTSLHHLTIAECPCLEERCEQGTGEDWPKIAHVPNFRKGGDGNLKEWIASRIRQYLEEASTFPYGRFLRQSDLSKARILTIQLKLWHTWI
ncbi:putative disease resistance protein RGA3 [Corylus avellana]|uniref:putative disease resistance protein RGA3 n=1 Tax=Corylus avellana TaxID=13451 RepID=UPI00286C378D|nr:putative disease resistance protein RGA3 [Corylus avellana]